MRDVQNLKAFKLVTCYTAGHHIQKFLRSAHKACWCVLCGFQNIELSLPSTVLTYWFWN